MYTQTTSGHAAHLTRGQAITTTTQCSSFASADYYTHSGQIPAINCFPSHGIVSNIPIRFASGPQRLHHMWCGSNTHTHTRWQVYTGSASKRRQTHKHTWMQSGCTGIESLYAWTKRTRNPPKWGGWEMNGGWGSGDGRTSAERAANQCGIIHISIIAVCELEWAKRRMNEWTASTHGMYNVVCVRTTIESFSVWNRSTHIGPAVGGQFDTTIFHGAANPKFKQSPFDKRECVWILFRNCAWCASILIQHHRGWYRVCVRRLVWASGWGCVCGFMCVKCTSQAYYSGMHTSRADTPALGDAIPVRACDLNANVYSITSGCSQLNRMSTWTVNIQMLRSNTTRKVNVFFEHFMIFEFSKEHQRSLWLPQEILTLQKCIYVYRRWIWACRNYNY